jgi:DNA polymerase III alpha subunit (gram-positive type)
VFFDIECASVNKTVAKICAFGYVVCDEQFNIIESKDVLINPRGNFHLTDRKGDKGIVLPYSYDKFKDYPEFPEVYPKIKALLEDSDSFVVGHSTMNDVKYLNLETKRFKLPSFNFEFSDSQLVYMTLINDFTHQLGLEHIAQSLGVEFTPHRAVDDAYATMRIVQAMCSRYECGYMELCKKLNLSRGRISDYTLKSPSSKALRKYSTQVLEQKKERSRVRSEFFDHVNKQHTKSGKFNGKCFTFSRTIEDNLDVSKNLVDKIYCNGGKYSSHITHSNYYIADMDDETPRTKNARKCQNLNITDINGLEELIDG